MFRTYIIAILLFIAFCFLFFTKQEKKQKSYELLIKKIAQKYDVDYRLIMAIIKQESNFTEKIRGKAGEYGLMQITEPATKDWQQGTKNKLILSESYLFRPEINIDIGTWYIAQGLNHWKGSAHQLVYALAEYNAGRGNLLKWLKKSTKTGIEVVEFKSTKQYIINITRHFKKLKQDEPN